MIRNIQESRKPIVERPLFYIHGSFRQSTFPHPSHAPAPRTSRRSQNDCLEMESPQRLPKGNSGISNRHVACLLQEHQQSWQWLLSGHSLSTSFRSANSIFTTCSSVKCSTMNSRALRAMRVRRSLSLSVSWIAARISSEEVPQRKPVSR